MIHFSRAVVLMQVHSFRRWWSPKVCAGEGPKPSPRSKTQVSEGEGPKLSPRSKTQVSEGGEGPVSAKQQKKQRGRRRGPRFRKMTRGAQRCVRTIRTVPHPLVPSSPVPTSAHKILINDVTAEVPSVNFDTDGVTFIIDNSATCILSNDRSLFVGPLKPADTCVQTTSGFSSPQFVGTIRLRFVTDKGQTVSYDIDDAIYDPDSGFNILGIPPFSAYMAKKLGIGKEHDDETWIKLGATESHFQWEGGKHSRHFTHG